MLSNFHVYVGGYAKCQFRACITMNRGEKKYAMEKHIPFVYISPLQSRSELYYRTFIESAIFYYAIRLSFYRAFVFLRYAGRVNGKQLTITKEHGSCFKLPIAALAHYYAITLSLKA